MVDLKLLEKLMEIKAVSGAEEKIRSFIMKQIKSYIDDMRIDRAGNLIAHQKGPKPTVMLAAHMDEVGLMVKKINSDGKILFEKIGGVETITIVGQRVLIEVSKKKKIQGVISSKNLSEGDETEELPEHEDLFVDTGLSKKELVKIGVKIGDYMSLVQENVTLGSKNILCGKAVDDRVGCYILIQLIKACNKSRKNEMYFVFTVQEEMGLYGAKTSAFEVKPDWAIAVDVTDADDTELKNATKILGKGPTVTVKDSDMIGNKDVNDWIRKIGKKKKIPIQWDVSDKGTTDAISIYFSRGGVPATVVGVPMRNMHSTIGVVNTDDIEKAVKLLTEVFRKPPKISV